MGKKKKTKSLIILVVVMLVCVAGYIIISNINFDKEEEDTSVPLYEEISPEDVKAFSYDVDGTTYSFSLINDVWYCDTELSMELDQDKISGMLAILTGFSSERVLEVAEEDYADYGLDEPYKVVTFTTSDGTVHTLTVGEKNINSKYYAYKDDDSSIYTIDATINTYFGYTLDDLKAEEETTEDTQTVESVDDASSEETDSESAAA